MSLSVLLLSPTDSSCLLSNQWSIFRGIFNLVYKITLKQRYLLLAEEFSDAGRGRRRRLCERVIKWLKSWASDHILFHFSPQKTSTCCVSNKKTKQESRHVGDVISLWSEGVEMYHPCSQDCRGERCLPCPQREAVYRCTPPLCVQWWAVGLNTQHCSTSVKLHRLSFSTGWILNVGTKWRNE